MKYRQGKRDGASSYALSVLTGSVTLKEFAEKQHKRFIEDKEQLLEELRKAPRTKIDMPQYSVYVVDTDLYCDYLEDENGMVYKNIITSGIIGKMVLVHSSKIDRINGVRVYSSDTEWIHISSNPFSDTPTQFLYNPTENKTYTLHAKQSNFIVSIINKDTIVVLSTIENNELLPVILPRIAITLIVRDEIVFNIYVPLCANIGNITDPILKVENNQEVIWKVNNTRITVNVKGYIIR